LREKDQTKKMSNTQQNSGPSQNQQTSNSGPKMMTQTEYLKYKQSDSSARNFYDHSRDVDVKPVAWVCLTLK
jgi:hypothetical protein